MIVLSKKQILSLHDQLIHEIGGIEGVRDDGLLEAAIQAPFQSFDGKDIFTTIQEKAARLGYGLVKNHAFVDGNKRNWSACNAGVSGTKRHQIELYTKRIIRYFSENSFWSMWI